jgi:hypothetical protein
VVVVLVLVAEVAATAGALTAAGLT